MKYKFPIILTLLILIPLMALAWLGVRLQNNEKIVVQHQLQQLVDSRLRESDQMITGYFAKLENELLATPYFYRLGNSRAGSINNEIRQYIRRSPYVENIFVLNKEGKRLHPQAGALISQKERQFVEKTEELWADMNAFRPSVPSDISSEQQRRSQTEKNRKNSFSVSGALSRIRRSPDREDVVAEVAEITTQAMSADTTAASVVETPQEKSRYGWTVWYAGTETQTFFWFWDAQNNLVGLKLASVYWLSELINQLPDQRNSRELLGDARIKLLNEKQALIYQWGGFEDELQASSQPQGQRLLGHPLDGWRLAYFSPVKHDVQGLQWLFYVLLLGILGLLLAGLAVYMMREYRRDMRLAEQRVTFVNQVSHELKTPLTNICMYADLLDDEVENIETLDEGLVRKYSAILTTESQRLGRLINNVLTFSRGQKQESTLNLQRAVVDDVLQQTIELFKPAFDAKGIELELELAATQIVRFDAEVLGQVINNLLGNIEKYAHHGRFAKVSSSQVNNITTIVVEDAGAGVDVKQAELIFEPFYRGDSKLTEGVSGTGIGLSIARDLCRLHGGDLTLVMNKDAQFGARFVATIATSELVSTEMDNK